METQMRAPADGRRARGRRALRRAAVAAGSLAAGLLVVALLAFLALRVPAVQRALVDRGLRAVRDASGLVVAVEGAAVDVVAGRASFRGVTVATATGRPFAAVPAASVEVDVRAALERRLVIRSLEANGVTLDLGAPLPEGGGARPRRPGEPLLPDLEVERFRLGIDSILSGPLPAAVQKAVLAVRAERVVLDGSLRDGRLRVRLDAPLVVIDRPGPVRTAVALRGRAELDRAGDLSVPSLEVEGEGLSVHASATAALDASSPVRASLAATLEPSLVAPEAGIEGEVAAQAEVSGTLAAPRVTARVRADALELRWAGLRDVRATLTAEGSGAALEDLTASLATGGRVAAAATLPPAGRELAFSLRGEELDVAALAPFLPDGALERWGLSGTRVDLQAGGRLPDLDPSRLSADALVEARRGDLVLAEGSARVEAGVPAVATIGLDLLPASPGRRSLSARLSVPELSRASGARVAAARAEVEVPDLARGWEELAALFPALVPSPPPGPDLSGRLLLTATATGPVRRPDARVEARWDLGPLADVTAAAEWSGEKGRGSARAVARSFPLSRLDAGASGVVFCEVGVSGRPGALAGSLEVDAGELCAAPGLPLVPLLHAEGTLAGDELSLPVLSLEVSGGRVAASGRASAASPLGDSELALTATRGTLEGSLAAVLRDGLLTLDASAGASGALAALAASVPLGALRALDLPKAVAARLPEGAPDGLVFVHAVAPESSLCALEPLAESLAAVRGAIALGGAIDLAESSRSSLEVRADGLSALTAAGVLSAEGPVRLLYRDGRLELPRVTVVGPGTRLALAAGADLDVGALAGGRPLDAVGALTLAAEGRAEAALLDPYLAGGKATGALELSASARGRPGALEGSVSLRGPEASLLWAAPYATQLSAPELAVDLATLRLTKGALRWNGGSAELAGGLARDGSLDLMVMFDRVRYRLAYGLAATLAGALELELGGPAERRLSGVVSVERGVLTRDVDLDRELLTRLLAPPAAEGTEASFRDTLGLDVDVVSESGVRVRNNVADLTASWSTLSVTGTARTPVIRGRIEVERGGLVFAYGQTFRVDRGTVTYAGDPATDPRLDFVTTSGLEDPSIGSDDDLTAQLGGRPRSEPRPGDKADAGAELARGLAGYYGERLAAQLNQAIGIVKVSLRPVLVFGETDPGTQLTVSRDVSRNVTLAVAVDLKNAQRQTYLLDVHGLRRLPPLSAQVFTNEEGSFGATLQQRLELGGSPRERRGAGGPLVASVSLEAPATVSRKALRSAIRIEKGEPADAGTLFDAEIDAAAALGEQGFPAGAVSVTTAPSPRKPGRVDVTVRVDPGARVEVVFAGDVPASAFRREIRGLYRPGPLEPSTLEEVRAATVRAFRTTGHVSPDVAVSAEDAGGTRRVTVRSTAGARSALTQLVLPGVPAAEAAIVAARVASPLARAELAAGVPSADARLLAALDSLGYPNARLLSRELAPGGETLTVAIETGRPSILDSVTVEGLPADEAARLLGLVPLAEETPARTSRIAEGAVLIEEDLAARGYAGASVRTVVGPASPEVPPRLAVTYVVAPGTAHTLRSVRFEGTRSTREALLGRVAGLTPGTLYRKADVDEARGRLYRLGLFSSLRAETTRDAEAGLADVAFVAREAPRFSVAYGVRWENEFGAGAVVDVVDRNFLGRGVTVGLRGLYDPNDREARFYLAVPSVFTSEVSLEAFLGAGREEDAAAYGTRVTDRREATLQLSRPLGRTVTGRLYGRYQVTDIFEPTDDPDFPFAIEVRLPYLGTQLLLDTREDPVLGTRGLFASLDLQASGSFLGSDYAFGRLYGQVSTFVPLARLSAGPVVWAQSVRAGLAKGFEGQEVIPDVRFFAGGQYSVRGYATDELGPREELGDESYAVGGTSLLVLNEELRVPFHPRLQGIAFADVGQAWARASDFLSDLAPSLGLGLRAITPVGVLRVDAAFPLRPKAWDPGFKLYFGFGNVF